MDCCGCYKRTPISIDALPVAGKSQFGGVFAQISFSGSPRSSFKNRIDLKVSESRRLYRCVNLPNSRVSKSIVVAAASAESSSNCNFSGVGTPLAPRSYAGKFLSTLLQNQRHLFPFAVTEQLDLLASDRDGAVARKRRSFGSRESCLHRRIAEMKENECQIAVEDITYLSIVHKFSEIGVPMVPRLSCCIRNGRLETWPSQDRELQSIHSSEVQEMIKEHISTILGLRGRTNVEDKWNTTPMLRLQLGRVYAASIMYGYFLKSASLRHKFESSFLMGDEGLPLLPRRYGVHPALSRFQHRGSENVAVVGESTDGRSTSLCQESRRCGRKLEKLRDYVMGFDSETLQRCARIYSKEAVNVIEQHTWALVGNEEAGGGDLEADDDLVILTFSGLERLVLEAVAFGSFLWDVERYVDSVYRLKENKPKGNGAM
ncbi:hypothetical protein Sjap_009048 [Stephania japonica]|uniref:UV-B-induced protein n=1 Tax=Stephania japonica TaxID=461633 RepID=A0AAP0JRG3_9MAGN